MLKYKYIYINGGKIVTLKDKFHEELKNFKDESIKEMAEKNLKGLERENNYE